MKISKLSGSFAAATLLLGLNTVAMADCDLVIAEIQEKADEIRFCSTTDPAEGAAPIWQWKGKPSCVVNAKVAKKLYVERTGDTPPKLKNPKVTAAGAAWDFMNGKYDSGQAKLDEFIYTLMYGSDTLEGQQGREDELVSWAVGVKDDAAMACQ